MRREDAVREVHNELMESLRSAADERQAKAATGEGSDSSGADDDVDSATIDELPSPWGSWLEPGLEKHVRKDADSGPFTPFGDDGARGSSTGGFWGTAKNGGARKKPKKPELTPEESFHQLKLNRRACHVLGMGPLGLCCLIYVSLLGSMSMMLYLCTYVRNPAFFAPLTGAPSVPRRRERQASHAV
mmetsp:Transcript_107553/g.302768  ORF Transcript_107553/g.302768 Transcript_107553/m.302768 type:complete len:187 (+) Transcript_107553:220-780(+)